MNSSFSHEYKNIKHYLKIILFIYCKKIENNIIKNRKYLYTFLGSEL